MENIRKAIEYELESLDAKLERGLTLSVGSVGVLRDLLIVRGYCEVKDALKNENKRYTLDTATAHEWVSRMVDDKGHVGEHWTMDDTNKVLHENKINASEPDFYAVMNMFYSDYSGVLEKHKVNTLDMYVDMARAWFDDKDAPTGKTCKYYEMLIDSGRI